MPPRFPRIPFLPRHYRRTLITPSPPGPTSCPPIHDFISPTPTHLLTLALSPHLHTPPPSTPRLSGPLLPGHHLCYFPPQTLETQLLPDGSEAPQSPGKEWTRRMWAGGELKFHREKEVKILDWGVLKEKVLNVEKKAGKVFVWFERRIWSKEGEGKGLMEQEEEDAAVVEQRCLVFLKSRLGTGAGEEVTPPRIVRPPHPPTFHLTLHPTSHLLFRFSSLTFNAHKIHYDPQFCREAEGYPTPLCHGPLSLVLLLELLRLHLCEVGLGEKKKVRVFSYRNLAPMYVGEPYKICGRQIDENRYELWAETPAGGYSVKAIASLEDI